MATGDTGSELESTNKLADVLSNKLSYESYIGMGLPDGLPVVSAAEEDDSILQQELFNQDTFLDDNNSPITEVTRDGDGTEIDRKHGAENADEEGSDWEGEGVEDEEEDFSGESEDDDEDEDEDEDEEGDDEDEADSEAESEILDEESLDKLESELVEDEPEAGIPTSISEDSDAVIAVESSDNVPSTSSKPPLVTNKKRKRKKIKKEKSKKKLKNKPNYKRKNIRAIISEKDLDADTLAAQKEEMERKQRLNELRESLIREKQIQVKEEKDSELKSLLQAAEDDAIEATKNSDVIILDKQDVEREEEKEIITLSSDEEDVVMVPTEDDNIEEEDMNNAGSHINDVLNCPDEHGRVLVNLSHPAADPDVFLVPQIARAIKPHQIGGIRFLYDNVVESLDRHESNPGFGCILAHSMGLGKTLQMIGFTEIYLRYTKAKRALCIVPINTLQNWMYEFNMWTPDASLIPPDVTDVIPRQFKVFLMNDNFKTMTARAKVIGQWQLEGGVLLMGYEMYRLLSSRRSFPTKQKKSKKSSLEPEIIDVDEEDKNKSIMIDIYAALVNPGPDIVICDEGHRIKNSHAGISQSLKNIKTRRRVVLTGYPLQNNLQEYWCMVDFVRPNFLGTKTEFSNMFERPMTNGLCVDSTEKDLRLLRHRAYVLHSLLEGFVQRRGHAVLNCSLPEKQEYVFMIRMSPIQRALYNRFMSTISDTALGSWANNNPLKSFSVCCKIWNHPDVLHKIVTQRRSDDDDLDLEGNENGIKKKSKMKDITDGMITYDWADELMKNYQPGVLELSGKMVFLNSIIEECLALGDKLLVFSQSLFTLNLIEEYLSQRNVPRPEMDEKWCKNRSYFRLDGSTSAQDREKLILQFNQPDNNISWLFLLSTRAGCLGINLIGANRVVVFDASWNPCHDAQAICRVFRFGQKKGSFIYRLVMDNTLERKIYDRQVNKQKMSDRVIDDLNPDNMRRSTNDLLQYQDRDFAEVDLGDKINEYTDTVMRNVLIRHSKWITDVPFTHESLLLDRRELRLSKREKQLAKEGYARDKKLSVSYGRPSYAAFYPNRGFPILQTRPGMVYNRQFVRPVASVKPMISTPVPMGLKTGGKLGGPLGNSMMRPGVSVHQVITTTEIVLPGSNTATQAGEVNRIPPGQRVLVIKTLKGVYIRTADKKLFAVRSKGLPGPSMAPPGPLNLSSSALTTVSSSHPTGLTRPIPAISSTITSSSTPSNLNIKIITSGGSGGSVKEKKLVINRNSNIVKGMPKIVSLPLLPKKSPITSELLQNELMSGIYSQTDNVNTSLPDSDSNSDMPPGVKTGERTLVSPSSSSRSSISSAKNNLDFMVPENRNPLASLLGEDSTDGLGSQLANTLGTGVKPVGISKPATSTNFNDDDIIPVLSNQSHPKLNNDQTIQGNSHAGINLDTFGQNRRSTFSNTGSTISFPGSNSRGNMGYPHHNPRADNSNTASAYFPSSTVTNTDNAQNDFLENYFNRGTHHSSINKDANKMDSASDIYALCNQYSGSENLDYSEELGEIADSNISSMIDGSVDSSDNSSNPLNSHGSNFNSGANGSDNSELIDVSPNYSQSINNMEGSTANQNYNAYGNNYNPLPGFGNVGKFNSGSSFNTNISQGNAMMDPSYGNPYTNMAAHPFFPYFPQHNYPMMGQAPGMGMHMGGMPMMGGFNPGMIGAMQPPMMSQMATSTSTTSSNSQPSSSEPSTSNQTSSAQVPQGVYGMPYMNTTMNPFMYNSSPNSMYMPMMNPFTSMAAQQMNTAPSGGMNPAASQSSDQPDNLQNNSTSSSAN